MGNYSAKATNYPKLVTVTVQMCPIFVRFDLRCVLPVREEDKTDENGVQLNSYKNCYVGRHPNMPLTIAENVLWYFVEIAKGG